MSVAECTGYDVIQSNTLKVERRREERPKFFQPLKKRWWGKEKGKKAD